MVTTVRLGFGVPDGQPVEIPLKHLAICGQTQEAGKTTALEALITRAACKAITFVTKRGEGTFQTASRHPPYFREDVDWQFVASILEAARGERLKFERAWIIRASRGAQTLEEVQHNVRKLMHKAKGLSADVYLTLDAYLDQVVPSIAAVDWATEIRLRPGVNVMDLTGLPVEMQHLVIRSSLDWVQAHEGDTVVVIPEAWKFIPQGRNTPVKLAAEALIRQGAALRNYVWLDSQDLGGIDKVLLRSVVVWLLGVQREANEIQRTLANIPEGIKKPTKTDLATLHVGEFYACWSREALRTYAQPVWLDETSARAVAQGLIPAHTLTAPKPEEVPMSDIAAHRLKMLETENAQLRQQVAELTQRLADRDANVAEPQAIPAPEVKGGLFTPDEEMYRRFKARLFEDAQTDPRIVRVLAKRTEIVVETEPVTVTVAGDTVKGRVARLIAKGFFTEPQPVGAVRKELARTGADPGGGGALGILLGNLVKDRLLTRDGGDYIIAPDVRVTEKELRA